MAKVTVYTKNNCPQCDITKNILTGEGVEFKAINVEDVVETKIEEIDSSGNLITRKVNPLDYIKNELGFSATPVIVAEGHEPFSGFRPDKLKELAE